MRLATIDPHGRKAETKFYKIPKFGVNSPIVRKIQPFENVKIYSGRCPTKRPDGHTFLCKF